MPLRADGAGTGPYGRLAADGLRYGPAFRGMRAIWGCGEELYADVALPEAVRASGPEADGPEFVLHPALFDAALYALALDGLVKDGSGAVGPAAAGLSLPFALGGVRVHTTGVQRLRVRVGPGPDGQAAVELTDETGSPGTVLEQGPHRHAEDLGLVFADEGGVSEHLQDDHAASAAADTASDRSRYALVTRMVRRASRFGK
ncbi:polyketide synthase dehydratase domain-containing protein [Streptomyces malaysiensis]|uniref:polyketide synthase dehydratase domain-containing protein n=1 Tax=Streptomyces malaysiensis TaxID=92644 RepID=UPI002B2F97EF|nr:polyketide synthase dehydratase domain-containing protein [Streptomyces malaysiensis]